MSWLQITLEIDGCDADGVACVLDASGAISVTTMDAGDEPLLEPAPGETPLWRQARVVALFDPDINLQRLREALEVLYPVVVQNLLVEQLDDQDWSNIWRDSFSSMRFGRRLWVCPSGESCADPDAVVVRLDPGLAFGTGTHATTAMCLEWLDAHPPLGCDVVDYGCGSGILAIAAHKLGARHVFAVDIDPQALQATRDNAERNDIVNGLSVQFPEKFDPGQAGLVIANILANPLVELAARLSGYLESGASIIMTGILADQAEYVMAAYRDAIEFSEPRLQDGWVLLAGRKR